MSAERAKLSNTTLWRLLAMIPAALLVFFVSRWVLPPDWLRPGSGLLQSAAAVGSLLLLVPFVFSARKRGGNAVQPHRWFIQHVIASILGLCLVLMHLLASPHGPPLLMFLLLVILIVSGTFGRLVGAALMAATPGTKLEAFGGGSPELKGQLSQLISDKQQLLQQLDATADEAVFSVTLKHWLRSPHLAWRYHRLSALESRLIGARQSVSTMQAWWRPLHIAAAWCFLFGLLVHVIVVIFFAGYAAQGDPIYWWHLAQW